MMRSSRVDDVHSTAPMRTMTDYGSYEFVIEDLDGRQIGIGRIAEADIYFKDSDLKVIKEEQPSTNN